MPDPNSDAPEEPEPCSCTFTLHPLFENGPDALPPDKTQHIAAVKLSRLVLEYDDDVHEVITCEADDLLKAHAAERRPPIPPPRGAKLVSALFSFLFDDGTEPNSVELRPPYRARLEHRGNADRVAAWFVKYQYACCSPAVLTQLLSSLLLAIILAAGCIGACDDDDDDDPDDEERTCLTSPT